MKIKTKTASYEDVIALSRQPRKKPRRSSLVFRALMKILSAGELKEVGFTCEKTGMERLGRDEPCLILMNHSSFIDLKIASTLLYPRPFHIVCTSDAFVGKDWLLRRIGCIPAQKFVSDPAMVKDMIRAIRDWGSSVLMYPEASYSFDGTATPLPDSVGKCVKLLKIPVILIRTHGAFLRDPLYNGLQIRKTRVTAEMRYLLSPEEAKAMSAEQINAVLKDAFSFDNFREQRENHVKIPEPFRADGLNRVLYRCPHCQREGNMLGKGITLTCQACGKTYTLTEEGRLEAAGGSPAFTHIPDWYAWERDCVRRELEEGTYRLDIPVRIGMLVDTRCIYMVGDGRLTHDTSGFHLTGCDGKLDYRQEPLASYSLYADYFWYEIGDMICIGDSGTLYYCFPKEPGDVVAKTRLAAEELYKLCRPARKTEVPV